MKSGPNISDINKINKMLANGAEPAGISAVLGIQLKSILMFTDEGKKLALEHREQAAVDAKKVALDEAIARAKAEAEEEVAAEEQAAMLSQVKADTKAKLKGRGTGVPPPFKLPPQTPPTKPPGGKQPRPPVTK